MYREQDETESMLRDSVTAFLQQEHSLVRLRKVRPGRSAHDRGMWKKLAGQGWLAMRLAEDRGGSGLSARYVATVAEAFGKYLMPEPLVTCALMPSVMADFATRPEPWHPIMAGLVSGESIPAMAWQEDPQSFGFNGGGTIASRQEDTFCINGVKYGVGGAAIADVFLVTARLADSLVLLAVPSTAEGVSIEALTTSDGGSLGILRLDNVILDSAALLLDGDSVSSALTRALNEAILVTVAQLTGLGEAALDIALEYMRTRVQFDRPIGSFQSLQHWAVDLKLQHDLALASYLSALQKYESAPDDIQSWAAIAAAKARASDMAVAIGRFGVQVHGAIGFAVEADIGLYLKSALRLASLLGNGAFQRQRFLELAGVEQTESGQ